MNSRAGGGWRGARGAGAPSRNFRAVAWSFFGVRKSSDLERDVQRAQPGHVIIAAVVAAALFVVGPVALVGWVIRSGVRGLKRVHLELAGAIKHVGSDARGHRSPTTSFRRRRGTRRWPHSACSS
jgi:hypothetical protein